MVFDLPHLIPIALALFKRFLSAGGNINERIHELFTAHV